MDSVSDRPAVEKKISSPYGNRASDCGGCNGVGVMRPRGELKTHLVCYDAGDSPDTHRCMPTLPRNGIVN